MVANLRRIQAHDNRALSIWALTAVTEPSALNIRRPNTHPTCARPGLCRPSPGSTSLIPTGPRGPPSREPDKVFATVGDCILDRLGVTRCEWPGRPGVSGLCL